MLFRSLPAWCLGPARSPVSMLYLYGSLRSCRCRGSTSSLPLLAPAKHASTRRRAAGSDWPRNAARPLSAKSSAPLELCPCALPPSMHPPACPDGGGDREQPSSPSPAGPSVLVLALWVSRPAVLPSSSELRPDVVYPIGDERADRAARGPALLADAKIEDLVSPAVGGLARRLRGRDSPEEEEGRGRPRRRRRRTAERRTIGVGFCGRS